MDDGQKGKWRVIPNPRAEPALNVIEHAFEAETKPFDAKIVFKGKPKRNGKPWVDGSSGASWCERFKRFMDRVTLQDRRNNRYVETVKDPTTGEVIHHCEEPLSDHIGHGTAKTGNRE